MPDLRVFLYITLLSPTPHTHTLLLSRTRVDRKMETAESPTQAANISLTSGAFHELKSDGYKTYCPRFCSTTSWGHHGPIESEVIFDYVGGSRPSWDT